MRSSIFSVLIICLSLTSCEQNNHSKIKLDFSSLYESQYNYFSQKQDTLILRPENLGIPLLFEDSAFSSLQNKCPTINCKNETDTEILGMYAIEAFTIEENMSKLTLVEHGEAGLSKRYRYIVVASIKDQTFLSESDIKIGMSKDDFFNKLKLDKPEILENNSFHTVMIEDHWGIQLIYLQFNTSGQLKEVGTRYRDRGF